MSKTHIILNRLLAHKTSRSSILNSLSKRQLQAIRQAAQVLYYQEQDLGVLDTTLSGVHFKKSDVYAHIITLVSHKLGGAPLWG